MPEEGKRELASDGKFVKEICFDSEVGGKFYVGKSERETFETFILRECGDEKVVLMMGSDCSTEDLGMDDEVFSDWSSEVLFNIDNVTSSVITDEELHTICEDRGEKTEFSQDTHKEAETTNHKPSAVTVDSSSVCAENESQNRVNEGMISYSNDVDKEAVESTSIIQPYPGRPSYSGSISLRSTSSTASAQSFAFPILAPEFNSSPERMPEPHKRQLTKLKRWKMKMCWVCCKF